MLSVVEEMKQCARSAEISLARQRPFSLCFLLYKSHVQVKYVNFSMCICETSHLRTLNENNYKFHSFKPIR